MWNGEEKENGGQVKEMEKKKRFRQVMAWVCIGLLAVLLVATLVFALLDFPGSDALFRACLAADIGLPVLLWIYIWLYGKVTNRHTAASFDLFQTGERKTGENGGNDLPAEEEKK